METKTKFVFESQEPITFTSEDSGCSLVIDDGEPYEVGGDDKEVGINIEIRSWDDTTEHVDLRGFEGKRLRVTVEVLD